MVVTVQPNQISTLLCAATHHNGLLLLRRVLDGDALNLLIEALHAVAEAGGRRLGYGDGDQDGFGHL